MLPLTLLRSSTGHPVLVELKNGDTYSGVLVSIDSWMNLNLADAVRTSAEGDSFWSVPKVYIRGNTVKYVRAPEEIVDIVAEEAAKYKNMPRGGGRGGRGGFGGRGGGVGRGGRGGGGGTAAAGVVLAASAGGVAARGGTHRRACTECGLVGAQGVTTSFCLRGYWWWNVGGCVGRGFAGVSQSPSQRRIGSNGLAGGMAAGL
ncbi:hypothetical protein BU14_0257s0012 [Porphyra umbilicalis]|uniref:U6 snRNA-associated Sm-like protein LSm4 n=1 Tax=Porphyra umbilicalis TaxID=2786 RepID=A0A1X6P2E3_PORUM|nr:hypothetical protein BU14_0257s0012 [Porphyra umbilicalis]|eukprot:OSX75042.1 hypothetical protein BU14_0257s0012 [Porphyra umbilicalis]